MPQVIEVHRTTGAADLLCRVVVASNAHLAEVLDRILEVPGAGSLPAWLPAAPAL